MDNLSDLTCHGHLGEGQDEGGGVGLDHADVVVGHVGDSVEEDYTTLDILVRIIKLMNLLKRFLTRKRMS